MAIVGAARTPIGKFGGGLSKVPSPRLGQIAVREALRRASVAPTEVDDLLFGCSLEAGLGQNPARQVLLGCDIPVHVGATTINKVCGSGMKSLMFGASEVRAGDASLVVVGGMESMDLAPYLLPKVRWGMRYGEGALLDAMLTDSLLDAYDHEHMGMTGEAVARKFKITREEADAFSLRSHQKAIAAWNEGRLQEEVVPVPAEVTGGAAVERDEGPRADTSLEKLAKLKPAFSPKGVLTPGNSSQISDGAAALVLASEEKVAKLSLKPLAWIRSYHVSGVPPPRVMESPIPAVKEHLKKEKLTVADLDLFEHNEAFSTASIAVQRTFQVPEEKFNVNGGAVALGHPIGCSGARIVVTLLHEMLRRKSHRGLATLCMGGGNGTSVILESAS
ncbi:MAG: acetyl-CoA C-acetyltransferase [Euryarchaeota archaeon]|nr:acetyl-CoA C-acetyltransferase [Euryarchaeota archaeon]MDE1835702.1 acetyl-CoA C-acetyltransferase [Euryarchaeota archaeon]MDE1880436.1 acetyl-CoA C-acetyltransferase [Euryarchaeota archaeon]MDE2043892.1 acetyl-CoA C-acetyltransferase [Thermoplasmata archaeon]